MPSMEHHLLLVPKTPGATQLVLAKLHATQHAGKPSKGAYIQLEGLEASTTAKPTQRQFSTIAPGYAIPNALDPSRGVVFPHSSELCYLIPQTSDSGVWPARRQGCTGRLQ